MDITINNININYIDEGSGDVILMLHGWGSKAELFTSQINVLKKRYRVIAINLPGFGGSSEPFYPFSVDDFANFVLDFIKELSIEKVSLIGHSLGGRIIIKLMSFDNMIDVEKIVLIDSAGVMPERKPDKSLKAKKYKVLKAIFGNKFVKKAFPEAINKLKSKNGSEDYRNATPMMRDTLVKVVNEDLTPLFPENKADTLLIWGKDDTHTPVSDGELMEKMMPNSALVVLENAGHYSFLDQKYLFNQILKSYFEINEEV